MHLVPSSKSGTEEEGFTIIVLSKDRKQEKQKQREGRRGEEREREEEEILLFLVTHPLSTLRS